MVRREARMATSLDWMLLPRKDRLKQRTGQIAHRRDTHDWREIKLGSGSLGEKNMDETTAHLCPSYIEGRPGNFHAQRALKQWINQGTLGTASAAATEDVGIGERLKKKCIVA